MQLSIEIPRVINHNNIITKMRVKCNKIEYELREINKVFGHKIVENGVYKFVYVLFKSSILFLA